MKSIKKFFAEFTLLSVQMIVILVLFLVPLFVFVFITNNVFALKDTDFDARVFLVLRPYISDFNTRIFRGITFLASQNFLLPANILLASYYLFVKKRRWYSIKVPAVSLGSYLLMSSLKLFFNRPRPDDPVFEAAKGLSYPSGHAMSAMTFYGLLIYLVWKNAKHPFIKWALIIFLSLLILLIGFSRVYLRVHYASDVLGGFSLGLVWLVLSIWAINKIEKLTGKKIDPAIQKEEV